MALARSIAFSPLAPCSWKEARRISSVLPPAIAIALVKTGLKYPGISPAITILSRLFDLICSQINFTSGRGFNLNIWTVSTSGRLAEYFAIASIFKFLLIICMAEKNSGSHNSSGFGFLYHSACRGLLISYYTSVVILRLHSRISRIIGISPGRQ